MSGSCPVGGIGTLGASDVTVGPGRRVLVLGAVAGDGLLPGEGDVVEGVAAGRAVVTAARGGGHVLLDPVAAGGIGHAGTSSRGPDGETTTAASATLGRRPSAGSERGFVDL